MIFQSDLYLYNSYALKLGKSHEVKNYNEKGSVVKENKSEEAEK